MAIIRRKKKRHGTITIKISCENKDVYKRQTEDPVNCLIHKTYSVEIDDNSVMVEVPVTKASEDMGLNKAE